MSSFDPEILLNSFLNFGDLLKYLRRRARLTQRELSIAVGYSEAQISRLEQNQRPPDLASLMALFIPALYLEDEPQIVGRLMELAAQARGETLPQSRHLSLSRSVRREITETVQIIEDQIPGNLPLQLTSFIGREKEIAEIKRLLDWRNENQQKSRLITLTGSGGCGKTRLALEVAGQLAQTYRDGAWFIELASISDPLLVLQAVNSTLGLTESRDGAPIDALTKYLRTKHILLIFDNCEQVVAETAQIAEEILRACPDV
jgi:transcriptional regulator with XRE-family HTH domain